MASIAGENQEADPPRIREAPDGRLWPEQERAWAAVEAECPAGADAEAHRAGERPLVHTSRRGSAVSCRPGQRRSDLRAYFHPEGGLLPNERTTDVYRFAELAGRVERLPEASAAAGPRGILAVGPRKAVAPAAPQLGLFVGARR